MKTEQLNRLLNTACEIISVLECNADANLQNEIDAFFNEVIYSDELDAEMERMQTTYAPTVKDIAAANELGGICEDMTSEEAAAMNKIGKK